LIASTHYETEKGEETDRQTETLSDTNSGTFPRCCNSCRNQ